jgi:hypothetical protein
VLPPPPPPPPPNFTRNRQRRTNPHRQARRERGPSKPGWRKRCRERVGAFNARGLRKSLKLADLARAFKERNLLCAGISETWLAGDGIPHEPGVCFVHRGLTKEEQPAGGKWGIAFALDHRAREAWEKPGGTAAGDEEPAPSAST